MKIPTSLIPYCPHCGKPMTMNLRCDDTFVEDEGWHQAYFRYQDFIRRHQDLKIVYLELGVGQNTPGIIKYPFLDLLKEIKMQLIFVLIKILIVLNPWKKSILYK